MSPQKRYWHDYAGFNFRMTNMQAAVGVAQMGRIEELLDRKKLVFQAYDRLLSGHQAVSLLPKNNWSENSNWLYTIILNGYEDDVRDKERANFCGYFTLNLSAYGGTAQADAARDQLAAMFALGDDTSSANASADAEALLRKRDDEADAAQHALGELFGLDKDKP